MQQSYTHPQHTCDGRRDKTCSKSYTPTARVPYRNCCTAGHYVNRILKTISVIAEICLKLDTQNVTKNFNHQLSKDTRKCNILASYSTTQNSINNRKDEGGDEFSRRRCHPLRHLYEQHVHCARMRELLAC